MKRSLSPPPDRNLTKRPRKDGRNEQQLSFQFQDGRLVDLRDAGGVPVAPDRIRDLDALHHAVQQNFPAGRATIILDQTAVLSAGLGPTSKEGAVEGLPVYQPVVSTLLAFLPLGDWFKLRHLTRCWRDAVDLQLKSLKQLNVPEILEQGHRKKGMKDAQSLLGFMSAKTPAVQSLVVGKWITSSPEVLSRFEKLKHLDMEGAKLNPNLMRVLEELKTWESLKTIAFPSESFSTDQASKGPWEDRLQVLMGRFQSLESLTFSPFKHHPTLLNDLKNPEKLTSLSVSTSRTGCPLPMLRSLPRFSNLQHLALPDFLKLPTDKCLALETALKELKALKRVDLSQLRISVVCVQRLAQLPELEWLTATSDALPECIQWAQLGQLTCLELGPIKEKFINYINQMTTLNSLKLSPDGRVKFACSLPHLHTLCLTRSSRFHVTGEFVFDFHPACCNLKNLSLQIAPVKLPYINTGLLKYNTGIRNLRIGWPLTESQATQEKAKSIAKQCKDLETLEFSDVDSVEAVSQVATVLVDVCPLLKNLKTNKDYVKEFEKRMKKFSHLSISVCSSKKDSWLFQ